MIPYKLPQEKKILLHYADLLDDQTAKQVLENDALHSDEEAENFARFFWQMVHASNSEDKKIGQNSEYILEKIIITLMAYYRSSGYEDIWDKVSDEQ